MSERIIYHACRAAEWRAAKEMGVYEGSPQDKLDGFIHLSSCGQVVESVARHKAGEDDLVLLSVNALALGEALKWEPAGNGQLFPHLYSALPLAAVVRVDPLRLGDDGKHMFPVAVVQGINRGRASTAATG